MASRVEVEWQPEDYLRALWLHRWFIGLTALILGGFTALFMIQQPNIYQASARVLLQAQAPQLVRFQEVAPLSGGWIQGFLQTEYRVIASRAVSSRVIQELHLAAFPPFSSSRDPAKALQEMLLVEPVRGTAMVDIRISGLKPELVARIANAVAESYARMNMERRQETTAGGIQWLRDEVAKMEDKMHSAQLALQAFLEQNGTVDMGTEQQNSILQRIQALNAAITQTRKDRIEAETKYREKHPTLLELQAKERELQLALYDQEQKALEASRLSIQYGGLSRESKTSEEIYNVLLTRLKELSVQEGLRSNNIQVVDYALVPEAPIGPPRIRIILIAVLLGLGLGGGLSILREKLTKTFQTRRDFERLMEIPFLGHVPLIRMGAGTDVIRLTDHHSPIGESIRSIRTTLQFLLPADQPHALLVTSALPEEGKSMLCVNLAAAFQELGRKVLIIDGDLRRPNLHKLLHLNLEPGLSEYLQDKAALEDLVQSSPLLNGVSIVSAGMSPPQPTDLLSSSKLRALMEGWKKEYQYLLIDASPVLVAADASVLATLTDGVIFVLRAGRTHGEVALAGKQRLIDVGARIIGGILNGARLELERGYRYYYYYHRDRESKRARR
ncbi:MAG: polysaccharide biosynthesis tyrosine autokinase [Candidatus Omnitrophica bacterium]|nr:polysaccharide biosynthesis tyrosine autokinase [Candidatus Omnitrophota bacterium]